MATNCFPSRITSSKLASTSPAYLRGILLTAFRLSDCLYQTSWPQNCNQTIYVEQSMTGHIVMGDAMDLLMLISLLAFVKTHIYNFVNDQLIFLKFEKSNRDTLILRFTILSLAWFQRPPAKKYGIVSLQKYRCRRNSPSHSTQTYILTRT